MTHEYELLETIEAIRAKEFSDLPAALVKQIVLIERDFMENRQEAFKRLSQVIDNYLATKLGE
jgi:hypothetical protein